MNLVIWGCENEGIEMFNSIKKIGKDTVKCFADRNWDKVGNKVENLDVVSIYKVKDMLLKKEIDLIIAPSYLTAQGLEQYLRWNGIPWEKIYIMHVKIFDELLKIEGSMKKMLAREKLHHITSLEYEVVEHCNLNCKGCCYFANITEKKYKTVESFEQDLRRISELVDSIGTFKLLGGEPLLHDRLSEFIIAARKIYPWMRIAIVSNGILVRKIPDTLIKVMQENDAYFELTIYPINQPYLDNILIFLKEKQLGYKICHVADEFCGRLRIEGDSNAVIAENKCEGNCFTFGDGYIGKCPEAFKINVFNTKFGKSLPESKLDLYDEKLTGIKLKEYLYNPIDLCSFCGKPKFYEWNSSDIDRNSIEQYLCKEPW